MSTVRVQTGARVAVGALILDNAFKRLSGLTNISLMIRRASDGFYLDWADDIFKSNPVVLNQTMVEPDAAKSPGFYHLHRLPNHADGFLDLSKLVGKNPDDTYHTTVLQLVAPKNANNVPQIGEILEGDWVDSFIVVKQSFSYNPVTDVLTSLIWAERNGLVETAATAATVDVFDASGALQFSMAVVGPDAQGFFRSTKSGPGLLSNTEYYAVGTITVGNIKSAGKGIFTVG